MFESCLQSLRRIQMIAINTFRESIRDKILYNIVFLALGLAIFSIILGEWSVFDRAHVIKSITLSIMSLSGLLISVFVGISLVQKEIQKRTVLTLLAKPLNRHEFLLGKYLGLMGVVATHLILLTFLFYLILWGTHSDPSWQLLQAVYLIFWEMGIVVAIAMLFSSFSSPVLSSLFTLGLYAAGHLSQELLNQVRFVKSLGTSGQTEMAVMEIAAEWTHRLLPGLYRFNISHAVIHQLALEPWYWLWMTLYALGYITVFLAVGSWWFTRRDFL